MKLLLNRLSQREKRLLLLGVVALIAALVYRFYWYPLQQWGEQEQRILQRNAQLQNDMLFYAKQQHFIPITTLDGDLKTTLSQQAQKVNITLKNVEMSDKGVSFHIPVVSADVLWRWLAYLEAHYGIQTTDITVAVKGKNGDVSVVQAHVQILSGYK